MKKIIRHNKQIILSFQRTKDVITWIWLDILDDFSRKQSLKSVWFLMTSITLSLLATYVTKEVIDAINQNNRNEAFYWILLGNGILYALSRLAMAYHAYTREQAWNNAFQCVYNRLNQLFFNRTMGELISENNDVGPEQVEAAQNRIDNLLNLILFNALPAIIYVIAGTILITLIDATITLIVILVLIFNIIWFLYLNRVVSIKMKPIDRSFRRTVNRIGEFWHQFPITKVSGVEDKICRHISSEIDVTLKKDLVIWADWYTWLDVKRSYINMICLLGIYYHGLILSHWSAGEFMVMMVWLGIVWERFHIIGEIMRNLTYQTTRLRAIKAALTKPVIFDRACGIEYKP